MKKWTLLALVFAAACGDDDDMMTPDAAPGGDAPPNVRRSDCNPMGELGCALPFPSSVYLIDSPMSATGVEVAIPEAALPTNVDDHVLSPVIFNGRDGFSASASIVVAFPGGVDPTNLPSEADPGRSLMADSPTVLLDVDTGERVLHFAELDASNPGETDPSNRALLIRPMVKLAEKTRYVVAIRDSLHGAAGGALPVPGGFLAVRDGTAYDHPLFARVAGRYDAIFTALETAGVPKSELVVAWDFVTASDASVVADMLAGRDRILEAMGAPGNPYGGITVTEDALPDGWDPAVIKKRVSGTFAMPSVLTEPGENGILARDGEGKPMVAGVYQAPFTAIIPACVDTATTPVPILIYGHGLLGDATGEVGAGWLRRASNYLCMVVIGTDWRGMSSQDLATAILILSDFNRMPLLMDKLVQGINAFVALTQVARTTMVGAPEFMDGADPLLDPSRVYYYGNSQGGIFGGTFMAYDPVITRGVLGVGAANYSIFIERSTNWPFYKTVMEGAYPDPLDRQLLVQILQWAWDTSDPVTTVPGLGTRGMPVPGTPAKQILMQIGVGDVQVANVGSDYQARSMGIPVLGPAVRMPYGLTVADGPLSSGITFFDPHLEPDPPPGNTSGSDNGVHEYVRRRVAANEQMKIFFETGEIVQTCRDNDQPAACDCTDPAVCGGEL